MNKPWEGIRPFRVFDPQGNPAEPTDDGTDRTLDMRWWDFRDVLCDGKDISQWRYEANKKGLVIEEFTGMVDCTGTEIHEGDIVRAIETWQPFDHIGVVAFNPLCGAYYLTIPGKPDHGFPLMLHQYDCLHILGDIHDNPDIELSMLYHGDEGYQDADRDRLEAVVAELAKKGGGADGGA